MSTLFLSSLLPSARDKLKEIFDVGDKSVSFKERDNFAHDVKREYEYLKKEGQNQTVSDELTYYESCCDVRARRGGPDPLCDYLRNTYGHQLTTSKPRDLAIRPFL